LGRFLGILFKFWYHTSNLLISSMLKHPLFSSIRSLREFISSFIWTAAQPNTPVAISSLCILGSNFKFFRCYSDRTSFSRSKSRSGLISRDIRVGLFYPVSFLNLGTYQSFSGLWLYYSTYWYSNL
jgi:hypothetical protein